MLGLPGYWRVQSAAWGNGNSLCSLPPTAASSHSASVGRRPPSQILNACASAQLTWTLGKSSFAPTPSVHVEEELWRAARSARCADVVGKRSAVHTFCHPWSWLFLGFFFLFFVGVV